MTDHKPRLFADAAAVRRVGEGLLSRTLPKEEWTHEAHLAACLWLIAERADISAERDLPTIIRSYNASVGGVNDDTQGYHETLTQLYIAAVRRWLRVEAGAGPHKADALAELVNRLLASPMARRDWPLSLYSHGHLFSVAARRTRVDPDLGDWPA